jgi:hypothetical protein
MLFSLDKNACFGRFQFRWIGVPVLVLGFCAFSQAALGQAQLGTAESSFDQGPDKLPAPAVASIPPPPAPPSVAKARTAAKVSAQKAPAKSPPRSARENALNNARPVLGTKTPSASPMTAR